MLTPFRVGRGKIVPPGEGCWKPMCMGWYLQNGGQYFSIAANFAQR